MPTIAGSISVGQFAAVAIIAAIIVLVIVGGSVLIIAILKGRKRS